MDIGGFLSPSLYFIMILFTKGSSNSAKIVESMLVDWGSRLFVKRVVKCFTKRFNREGFLIAEVELGLRMFDMGLIRSFRDSRDRGSISERNMWEKRGIGEGRSWEESDFCMGRF